PHTVLQAV
nr:Chain B, Nonstructural protein 12/13 [Severe acute respiratory syndrome coronavirus 2]